MITWLDTRCNALMKQWYADGTADTVARLSGWHPFPGLPLPSIAWLQGEPARRSCRSRLLPGPRRLPDSPPDRLSRHRSLGRGRNAAGRHQRGAVERGAVRARRGEPAAQAELGWAGRIIGAITDEVASPTGLPAGTPVVAGGMDQVCASMAMGNIVPGRYMLSTGTAWTITGTAERPDRTVIPSGLNISFHTVTNRWTVTQYVGGFGAIVDWWLQQAWQSPDPAGPIREEAALRLPGPGPRIERRRAATTCCSCRCPGRCRDRTACRARASWGWSSRTPGPT